MDVDKVYLAEPRGFCAGVEMAIKALAWMVNMFDPPVYCYHEIVHNQIVVDRFKDHGVIFVDDIDQVPLGSPIMLSAHGSAPEVVEMARKRGGAVVNAVCPLVTKVHHELKVRAQKGYTVIYVGHNGHEEAIGTMAVAPQAVRLVEYEEDVDSLGQLDGPLALLAQTTLSHDEWSGVVDKVKSTFGELWMPTRGDLCFATTNRQGALKAIAHLADTVVVIGSANSSNTVALGKVANGAGTKRVIRVNSSQELPEDIVGTVAVTAGASAPEELVEEVLKVLSPKHGIEVVRNTDEDEYFPPPRELRELIKSIEDQIFHAQDRDDLQAQPHLPPQLNLEKTRSLLGRPQVDDRQKSASDVLVELGTD